MTLLLSAVSLRKVFDPCVRSWEEQGFVPVLVPADDVRRTSVGTLHFEHFAITVGFSDAVAANHDSISNTGAHQATSFSNCDHIVTEWVR
jgi:hypothetical protein